MPAELSTENMLIFDVYRRLVLIDTPVDIFRLMDAVGIKDQLACIDKVQMLISEMRPKK